MDGITSDIATKLLNSSDAKVVAAAKRIFFETDPDEYVDETEFASVSTTTTTTNNRSSSPPSSLLIHKFGMNIPSDIQEAASAVVMMAPKTQQQQQQYNVISSVPLVTSRGADTNAASALVSTSVSATTSMFASTSTTPNPAAPILLASTQTSNSSTQQPMQEVQTSSASFTQLPALPLKTESTDDARLQRSRERNKMHARKTRQRKKEHMNQLETRVQTLKERQMNVKLLIKEKNTANILLGMFATRNDSDDVTTTITTKSTISNSNTNDNSTESDNRVDQLLKRKLEDIPDSSKIPDLPALILPGHHNKRRKLEAGPASITNAQQEYPKDGIDYELLGKDRTSCTPEELDKIRKERNRMHAKRTRDRKRIFMEEMEKIIAQLENENDILEEHLASITSKSDDHVTSFSVSGLVTPSFNSPTTEPCIPNVKPPAEMLGSTSMSVQNGNVARAEQPSYISLSTVHELPPSQSQILSQTSSVNNVVQEDISQSNPLAVVSSCAISTVSMSPTPYQNRDHTPSECPQEPRKDDFLTSLQHQHVLPSSITTTSPGTAIENC